MKIWKMTPFAVAPLIMAMCLPVAAPAAQPDHSQLPEDAKWVIHVDLKALSQTELAQEARAERPQMTQLVRRWLQDNLGVDPREDLDSLTLFSNSYDQYTGTMILKANYDKDKVQAAIEERPDIHKEQWEGLTLPSRRRGEGTSDSCFPHVA